MPSLVNTNSGPISDLTWGAAKVRVARSVGGMSDPNILIAAGDALSEIIQQWNTEKDWRFLQIIAPNITTVSGTTRYALPTNFKKPYDAYLVGSQIKLEYIEQQIHDSLFPGGSVETLPAGYSLYNVGTTGEVEVLPVSVNDTLVVRYYRPILAAGDDGEFLDIPARYVPGILFGARALLCLDNHDYSGSDRWEARAQKFITWAKRDDDHIPDEELRFRPANSMINLNRVDVEDMG